MPRWSSAFLASLTMPKELARRRPAKLSTRQRHDQVARIRREAAEMTFRCDRCEKKNLRCFVDTSTGRCAGCIHAQAQCSLLVSEESWEEVTREKRLAELEIARLEAQLAQSRVKLLEVKEKEIQYARQDEVVLEFCERSNSSPEVLAEVVKEKDVSGMGTIDFVPSEPFADPGWSQAEPSSSFFDAFLADLVVDPVLGFHCGTSVPATCSP